MCCGVDLAVGCVTGGKQAMLPCFAPVSPTVRVSTSLPLSLLSPEASSSLGKGPGPPLARGRAVSSL